MLEWKEGSPIVNVTKKLCRENEWRVRNLSFDFDDLMQEAYIIYANCLKKFHGEDDAQFMSYYKESLSKKFNELSNKNTCQQKAMEEYEQKEKNNFHDGEQEAMFRLKMEMAPPYVKEGIKLLIDPPPEMKKYMSKNGCSSKVLCVFMGLSTSFTNQKINLINMIKEYISK